MNPQPIHMRENINILRELPGSIIVNYDIKQHLQFGLGNVPINTEVLNSLLYQFISLLSHQFNEYINRANIKTVTYDEVHQYVTSANSSLILTDLEDTIGLYADSPVGTLENPEAYYNAVKRLHNNIHLILQPIFQIAMAARKIDMLVETTGVLLADNNIVIYIDYSHER